jgi:hypothetical protein
MYDSLGLSARERAYRCSIEHVDLNDSDESEEEDSEEDEDEDNGYDGGDEGDAPARSTAVVTRTGW